MDLGKVPVELKDALVACYLGPDDDRTQELLEQAADAIRAALATGKGLCGSCQAGKPEDCSGWCRNYTNPAPSAPRREDAFTRLPVRCRWDCPDPCPEHEAPTRVERTPAETMLRSWIDRRGSNYAAVEIPEWPELTGIINALLKESIAADDARRAAKGSKP
jgi:hypothetical protein